jgi:hypothetical protein
MLRHHRVHQPIDTNQQTTADSGQATKPVIDQG